MRIRIICHKVKDEFKCWVFVNSLDLFKWQRSLKKYQEIRYILLNPTYNGEQKKSTFKQSANDDIQNGMMYMQQQQQQQQKQLKGWKRRYTRKSSVFRSFICAEITDSLEVILLKNKLPLNVSMFGYRIARYLLINYNDNVTLCFGSFQASAQ